MAAKFRISCAYRMAIVPFGWTDQYKHSIDSGELPYDKDGNIKPDKLTEN